MANKKNDLAGKVILITIAALLGVTRTELLIILLVIFLICLGIYKLFGGMIR